MRAPLDLRRLYVSSLPSGNAYKVQLLMAQLGLHCETVELDILASPPETRRPEFLAKNPNGRIPLIELEDGRYLAESNAILHFLADNTAYMPEDAFERAQLLQWMFFEQYSHEPYIAVMKFWKFWGGMHNKRPDEIALWQQGGQAALAVMERHLESRRYFVGERYTVADIALYAYTHTAAEAGFDLASLPALRAWLARVREQPRHVPIASGPGSIGFRA